MNTKQTALKTLLFVCHFTLSSLSLNSVKSAHHISSRFTSDDNIIVQTPYGKMYSILANKVAYTCADNDFDMAVIWQSMPYSIMAGLMLINCIVQYPNKNIK